jgi:hypothetical protein
MGERRALGCLVEDAGYHFQCLLKHAIRMDGDGILGVQCLQASIS